MKKTILICDCCGKEVEHQRDLYECSYHVRSFAELHTTPFSGEICIDCKTHIEKAIETEMDKLRSAYKSVRKEKGNDTDSYNQKSCCIKR